MPLNRPDKVLEVKAGSLDATSMRYHELWLQRWLYSKFLVREGYPVPVVFATPMDAFSLFSKLWADEANPFAYLLTLKDAAGTPLYEPHPSPVRYPLISVMRQGIKLRPSQNFSTHRWRHVNWPTISDTEEIPGKEQIGNELTHCDLGNVTVSRMPMAFDYKFQIDHYCLRPDTQARFIEKLLNQFWRTGGGVLQTWMDIEYPGWGSQYIRIYVEGEIDQRAPDDATVQDHTVEYRTTLTLTVEGFSIDVAYETHPALWKLILTSAHLDDLDRLLIPATTIDLRTEAGTNLVLDERPDIPMIGTCQAIGRRNAYTSAGTVIVYFGDPAVPDTPSDTVVIEGGYSYGIASTGTVGTPRFEFYGFAGSETAGLGLGLYSGTYSSGYSLGGTFSEAGTTALGFYAGTHAFAPIEASGSAAGTVALGFYAGSYVIEPIVDCGTFTDSGTLGARFLYGSHDRYILRDSGGVMPSFGTGAHTLVSALGGTHVGAGTLALGLINGTYAEATVWVYGTEAGTVTASFGTGTYLLVASAAGTYPETGTVSVAFGTGAHALWVVAVDPYTESGSFSVGFYTGTHAAP